MVRMAEEIEGVFFGCGSVIVRRGGPIFSLFSEIPPRAVHVHEYLFPHFPQRYLTRKFNINAHRDASVLAMFFELMVASSLLLDLPERNTHLGGRRLNAVSQYIQGGCTHLWPN